MKDKKNLIVALGGISLAVLLVLLIVILGNKMKATAEYSDEYNRIFGEFAAKTTSELLEKEENTCYSPISLFATLTLLAETTEGKSQEEILKVLGALDETVFINNYKVMLEDVIIEDIEDEVNNISNDKPVLNLNEPSVITLSNSLWLEKAYVSEKTDGVIAECKDKLNCDIFVCDYINTDEVI